MKEQKSHNQFGEVIRTHVIGEYVIEEVILGDAWKDYDGEITYSTQGWSFDSLDNALLFALCKKYEPEDDYLAYYVSRMIPNFVKE